MTIGARSHSELDVLTAVERGEVITQAALTKRIGVSIGLINALLRRAINKGYVKARQVPYKRFAYYLTPHGFREKSRLVATYLETSLSFFRQARREYAELFEEAQAEGKSRIVLAGSGELTEIAVLAAWSTDVMLLAILDLGANRPTRFGVKVIRSLAEVGEVDAVVITKSRQPQIFYEEIREAISEARVFAPPMLKITRDREDLLASAEPPP